jgi:Bacterial Ig-like domain (group 3)/FG-GAP-like repeat
MRNRILLEAALFLAFARLVAAQTSQFLDAPQYSTGAKPESVAVAYFNGDRNLDIAVANATSNTVSILLGNGDGTFQSKVDYATNTSPQSVVAADFNRDGNIDLAVTDSGSNSVSILLGNGDGSFQSKVDYPVGTGPLGIAVVDLNADGNLDLAVTNAVDGTVGILLGNGDGTFKAEVAYATGPNPYAVAVGDLNGDGVPDLAVANSGDFVSVLLGNGNGTFQGEVPYTTGNNPVAIVLADFNGDGNLDIAVADQLANRVSILMGNGNGTFQAHVDYVTEPWPSGLVVGDFDGDGNLDLAVSASDGNNVTILWGAGQGTFRGYVNYGTGDIPSAVAMGDFNNDGKPDLIATNSQADSVSVILNNGSRTFRDRVDYPAGPAPNESTGPTTYSIASADFNGDGIPDLAVANSNCPTFPSCGAGTIAIVLGNGDGSFQGPSQYSTGTDTDPRSVVVGDFNNDKIPDLAVANYATNNLSVLLGVGDGTFLTAAPFPVGSAPSAVAVGDFNSDGDLDLVAADFNSGTVSMLLGNGDGTFQSAVSYAVGSGPIAVSVADLRGIKKLDLVVVNELSSTISVLLGNGDGTFQTQQTFATGTGGNPVSVAVGDFNGDQIPDVAVADSETKQVSILLGKGNGTFRTATMYPVGASPLSVVAADFNGNGILDLALTSSSSGGFPGDSVSLLFGAGNGTFQTPTLFPAGYLANAAVVGDFNGDGTPDLAVANGGSNTVSLLLNTQGTLVRSAASANPSSYGQSLTFAITVSASLPSGIVPTGSVTLSSGSSPIGSGTLVNGAVTIGAPLLGVGTSALSASYSGDSNFQPHRVSFNQTVQKANTTVELSASPTSADLNQSVILSANVVSSGDGTPTGTVSFFNGSSRLGTSSLNASGIATFSVSTLPAGTQNIAGTYSGDGNFNTSTSPSTSVVVNSPNFSISAGALSPATVSPGASANSTVTITMLNGIAPSTVSLTCAVAPIANPAATCSVSQISMANNEGTATLSVATSGPHAMMAQSAFAHRTNVWFAFALLIPGIFLGGTRVHRPGTNKLLGFCMLLLMLSGCWFGTACGSGGSTSQTSIGGTPSGTYSVTVTGTSGTIVHTTSLSLTVQ